MLFAERHRKLGRDGSLAHDRAEDLLTSTVFQLLRYLPPSDGLIPLLRAAHPIACDWQISDADRADIELWPRLGARCCPDVLIRFFCSDRLTEVVLIEAKLYAGKSGGIVDDTVHGEESESDEVEPPLDPDQLAKYWQSLMRNAETRQVRASMIYLTAHLTPPHGELLDSRRRDSSMRLGWLSWNHVWQTANALSSSSMIASDLATILQCRGFASFQGFRAVAFPQTFRRDRFFAADVWFSATQPRVPARQRFWEAP